MCVGGVGRRGAGAMTPGPAGTPGVGGAASRGDQASPQRAAGGSGENAAPLAWAPWFYSGALEGRFVLLLLDLILFAPPWGTPCLHSCSRRLSSVRSRTPLSTCPGALRPRRAPWVSVHLPSPAGSWWRTRRAPWVRGSGRRGRSSVRTHETPASRRPMGAGPGDRAGTRARTRACTGPLPFPSILPHGSRAPSRPALCRSPIRTC